MRIGFVTCRDLPEPDFDAIPLSDACAALGMDTTLVPWDDNPSLTGLDLLVIRSTWNYHLAPDRFIDWVEQAHKAVPVFNPPSIVRQNMAKVYLRSLESHGVPIVPTMFVDQGASIQLADECAERNWSQIVVKPRISAGSWKTRLFPNSSDSEAQLFLDDILGDRGAMVQPFYDSVMTVGERSIACLGGAVSHVVVKRARFADGEEHVSDAQSPTQDETELVERCLRSLGAEVLYARLDLIQDDRQKWLVSELELIEPSLFLTKRTESFSQFARLIQSQASNFKRN